MSTIFSDIAGFCPSDFDSVVMIGCGSSFMPSPGLGILSKQWHLVEADPDLAARLESSRSSPEVVLHNILITPTGEPTDFYRYSWPFISGPLPMVSASALYPKLRVLEVLKPPTTALQVFLENLILPDGGNHLLVIDLPGQEAALLSALPDHSLDRWAWIAIRAAANPPQHAANPVSATRSAMATLHFEAVELGESSDPAWPVLLFRRDPVKAGMQAELENRARLLVQKAAQIHQQSERLTQFEAERTALMAESDELASRSQALAVESDALRTERTALMAERDELASRSQALAVESDALRTERAALMAERDELATRHQALVTEHEALSSDLAAKSTLLDVLSAGRVAQDEQMGKILSENKSLISVRDAAQQRISELESEVAQLRSHSKLIDEEFGKAEGQLELIKDIFLRETLR